MRMHDAVNLLSAMLLHERVGGPGGNESALTFAAAVLETDMAQGGTLCKWQHSIAHACRGRILAAATQAAAARTAFEAAAEAAESHGYHLLSAMALRDLRVHVLDRDKPHGRHKAGQGGAEAQRLAGVMGKLRCSDEELEALVRATRFWEYM